MGSVEWQDFNNWLRQQMVDVMIVENYRVRPVPMTRGHANTWSECREAQQIGACHYHCTLHAMEFIKQDPSIKPVGYGFAGLKYVAGKRGTHMQDAVAHGTYWWMEKGRHRVS